MWYMQLGWQHERILAAFFDFTICKNMIMQIRLSFFFRQLRSNNLRAVAGLAALKQNMHPFNENKDAFMEYFSCHQYLKPVTLERGALVLPRYIFSYKTAHSSKPYGNWKVKPLWSRQKKKKMPNGGFQKEKSWLTFVNFDKPEHCFPFFHIKVLSFNTQACWLENPDETRSRETMQKPPRTAPSAGYVAQGRPGGRQRGPSSCSCKNIPAKWLGQGETPEEVSSALPQPLPHSEAYGGHIAAGTGGQAAAVGHLNRPDLSVRYSASPWEP